MIKKSHALVLALFIACYTVDFFKIAQQVLFQLSVPKDYSNIVSLVFT